MELPFGKMAMYYDGASGWYSTSEGVTVVPPPVARQVREVMFRMPYTLLLSDRAPDRTVIAVANNSVEISDATGAFVRVDFEPSSGLPTKFHFKSASGTGEPSPTIHTYSDFHPVAGIMTPRRMTIEQNGQKLAEARITQTKINTGQTIQQLAWKP